MHSPLHSERQFIASWHTLRDHILVWDSRCLQRLLRAAHKLIDDCRIPAGVDYADAKVRSYETSALRARAVFVGWLRNTR